MSLLSTPCRKHQACLHCTTTFQSAIRASLAVSLAAEGDLSPHFRIFRRGPRKKNKGPLKDVGLSENGVSKNQGLIVSGLSKKNGWYIPHFQKHSGNINSTFVNLHQKCRFVYLFFGMCVCTGLFPYVGRDSACWIHHLAARLPRGERGVLV